MWERVPYVRKVTPHDLKLSPFILLFREKFVLKEHQTTVLRVHSSSEGSFLYYVTVGKIF